MSFWKMVAANLVANLIQAFILVLAYVGLAAVIVADVMSKYPQLPKSPFH